MKNELVSEADVERALDFLRDNARDIGEAKAAAVKAEHMLRHIKAVAMKISGEPSVSAQEREAYASDQYMKAIENAAEAAGVYEQMKALREAAAMKIESWRTQSSNYRSMKL
jgi:beta-phosphoglucomutase-like phosphatase (HAD superfamily)